jgi:hypothetical protein
MSSAIPVRRSTPGGLDSNHNHQVVVHDSSKVQPPPPPQAEGKATTARKKMMMIKKTPTKCTWFYGAYWPSQQNERATVSINDKTNVCFGRQL